MAMPEDTLASPKRQVWNAGRTVGAKRALKPKHIWEIRFYLDRDGHFSTRQYARLVDEWVTGVVLMRDEYGTHSLRRTKASITY